jgi:hypothetical protein
MIDNIAYDMIENLEASKMVDFLRMMDDYKANLYMEELNKETNVSEDFSDDLPF